MSRLLVVLFLINPEASNNEIHGTYIYKDFSFIPPHQSKLILYKDSTFVFHHPNGPFENNYTNDNGLWTVDQDILILNPHYSANSKLIEVKEFFLDTIQTGAILIFKDEEYLENSNSDKSAHNWSGQFREVRVTLDNQDALTFTNEFNLPCGWGAEYDHKIHLDRDFYLINYAPAHSLAVRLSLQPYQTFLHKINSKRSNAFLITLKGKEGQIHRIRSQKYLVSKKFLFPIDFIGNIQRKRTLKKRK